MVQGAVMKPYLGFIEAPNLDILDSVSVLISGYIVSTYLYPYLARHNIKLGTGIKFALGSALGALAILWSILVEHLIHLEYSKSGERINVMWQAPSYILIGAGEIFSISTAYEVAFTASPPNKKAFACAFNLFCIGSIPNILSLCMYSLCEKWFQNSSGSGNIRLVKDYSEAHVMNYFLVLLGIVLFGVAINLIPSISLWISSVERRAAEASMASTPKPTPKLTPKVRSQQTSKETDPLLSAKSHKKYLEQGTGPEIYRMNTMKAEFAKKQQKK
jgi:dipeptide/tripeptide permease